MPRIAKAKKSDRETHVSINNIGEYVLFPAETIH
jgi:hypothetical protein